MDTSKNETQLNSFKRVKSFIKKMRIRNGDVLLIKSGSVLGKIPTITMLNDAIKSAGYENVLLIVVDDFDDIQVADESKMMKSGWIRTTYISKLAGVYNAEPEKNSAV